MVVCPSCNAPTPAGPCAHCGRTATRAGSVLLGAAMLLGLAGCPGDDPAPPEPEPEYGVPVVHEEVPPAPAPIYGLPVEDEPPPVEPPPEDADDDQDDAGQEQGQAAESD